jgi:hypothetical protein
LIAGTPTNNAYYEIPMGDWQIAVKRAQDNAPTAQTLDVIWANTANSFNGAQITNNSLSGNKILDNSIGSSKLNNAGQMIPFAMASVNANTSLNKSLNISGVTKNGTGLYRVAFAAPASSANAIVIAVTNDGQGVNTVLSDQSTQAVVIRLMNLNGQNVDGGFDMIVYDF